MPRLDGLPGDRPATRRTPLRSAIALVLAGSAAPLAGQRPADPVPRIDSTGPALRFAFPGMRIGVAEYQEGPTGTTVFHFPKAVKAAVDVRGGAPGTLNTDAVRLGYESRMMQAVVFAGGSWYGLSAATGVANELKTMAAEEGNSDFIAGVLGAIIFDVGGRRFTRITPDDRLGGAAVRSAREGWFPLGARGAGRFAMQGVFFVEGRKADDYAVWPHSGQGGAFREIGPVKVGVFTVVNALGAVVDREGRVVRCRRNGTGGSCPPIATMLRSYGERAARLGGADGGAASPGPTGNTTITLVVTNQKLPYWALQRLAVQVHSSMARAIQPFATEQDGDVLYAVTTEEVDSPSLTPEALGAIASELAWDAVLASVPAVPPSVPRVAARLAPATLAEFAGSYQFPGGGILTVVADSAGLSAGFTGNGRIYFEANRRYRLVPIGPDLVAVEAPAGDVLRFDRESGRVTGLTVDPGPWSQSARRTSP